MTGWVIAAALLALAGIIALGAGLAARRRAARTLDRVEEMLTAAMEGRFAEEHFDESRLSALESRLARYLTASETSAGRVRQEKDRLAGLVADIAHQTRTPVANLRLYSQLLAEQPLSPAGQDCAAAIDAQSEKLGVLVEALVKTSRLETGLLALHPAPGPLEPFAPGGGPVRPRGGGKGWPSPSAKRRGRRCSTKSGRKRPCATCWTTP